MEFIKNKWILNDNELSKLRNMLADVQFSLSEIAKEFGVSVDTIVRIKKEYKLEYKRKEMRCERIDLTDIQKEVLNGCLLGDGCLNIHKNGKNAIFSYTSKSKEMVEYVAGYFSNIPNNGISYSEYYDKRTNNLYSRYTFKTHVNSVFTEIYHKWYVNKIKIIPPDLILTPRVCLFWYLGDGCLNNKTGYSLFFATNCFSKTNLEKQIIPQMKKFEVSLIKGGKSKKGETQYRIYIPRRHIKSFLDYIGDCPVNFYSYKWNIRDCVCKEPRNYKKYEDEFIIAYKNGESCYSIAKRYDIEINVVKHYIKMAGIYKPLKKENHLKNKVFELLNAGFSDKEIKETLKMGKTLFYYYKKRWLENGKKI
mgnify:CR=1 FL=1